MKREPILFFLFLAVVITLTAFDKIKKMNEKEDFNWEASVTSAKEYPIEVHKGYLATKKTFITGIQNNGTEQKGWEVDGSDGGMSGSILPFRFSLIWLSYAEKKFWKVDTTLPREQMLALFKKGFYNLSRVSQQLEHETYKHIVVAVAPSGVVVIFLSGRAHRIEIGRYQAKETFVSVNDFYDNPANHTQQGFYDWYFENEVSREIREKIKKDGIPYGIWDTYRQRYKYRFVPQFYKADTLVGVRGVYFNGEENYVCKDERRRCQLRNCKKQAL